MTTPQQKQQAFESAKKFGDLFPGLIDVLQEWASVGSIQQATEDAQRKFAAAKSLGDQQALELQMKAERSKQVMDEERKAADDAFAARKLQSAREAAQATLQSAKMIDDAKAQILTMSDAVAALKNDHAAVLSKIANAKTELADREARIAAAGAEHERIKANIAELKAKLG